MAFYIFRPLSGKHKEKYTLRSLRLCGEYLFLQLTNVQILFAACIRALWIGVWEVGGVLKWLLRIGAFGLYSKPGS